MNEVSQSINLPTTPAALSALVSAVLSVLMMIYPPARVWFAAQTAEWQRAIRAGVVVLVSTALMAFTCNGLLTGFACTQANVLDWIAGVVMVSLSGMAGASAAFGIEQLRTANKRFEKQARSATVYTNINTGPTKILDEQ